MSGDSFKYPLVSIITPVFNGALYLEKTIDSILAQDYPNIEYIVLDDGSTDETVQILKKYNKKIKWESHPNMGQSLTLNKGWDMSKGEILGYLSADDILFSNAISELVTVFLNNPNVATVYPNCDLIDFTGKVFKKSVVRPFNHKQLIIKQHCYIGPGALFRRKIYEKVGGWQANLGIGADREFWMRVGLYGDFIMHTKTLAQYRIHNGSTSYSKSTLEIAENPLVLIKSFFERSDVPSELLAIKHKALSGAYFFSSPIHLRAGRIFLAFKYLGLAKYYDKEFSLIKGLLILFRVTLGRIIRFIAWNCRKTFNLFRKGNV